MHTLVINMKEEDVRQKERETEIMMYTSGKKIMTNEALRNGISVKGRTIKPKDGR